MFQIKELPAVIDSDPEETVSKTNGTSDKMKIAFRYQNLSASDGSKINNFGHYYDLSKNMSLNDIENSDISYWSGQRFENGEFYIISIYVDLWNHCSGNIKFREVYQFYCIIKAYFIIESTHLKLM